MDAEHRQIIKDNYYRLQDIDYGQLTVYLQQYKMFNDFMWKDINSISDLLDLLPTRGPKAFNNFIQILRKTNYNVEADLLEGRKQNIPSVYSDKLYYKMSSKPLGYCLIINNIEFDMPKSADNQNEDLKYRDGSVVDATSLETFFKTADFEVEVVSNLKSDQMQICLEDFAKKDFLKVDSMILIIMSHGDNINNQEIIYGTDWGYLYKTNIYDIFNNKNCECLQTKPKVFFFIACRGKGRDYGVPKTLSEDSADSTSVILPLLSDILVIHSTYPNQISVRNHKEGTYSCQALVSVLNKKYKEEDIETMIKLANQELEGKISQQFRTVLAIHKEDCFWRKKMMLCRN